MTRSNRGRTQGSLTGLLHTSHVLTIPRYIPPSDGGSSPQQFPVGAGYMLEAPYIRTGGACDLPRSAGNKGSQNGNWSYGGTARRILELASDLDSWNRVLSDERQSGPKRATFRPIRFFSSLEIFKPALLRQAVSGCGRLWQAAAGCGIAAAGCGRLQRLRQAAAGCGRL